MAASWFGLVWFGLVWYGMAWNGSDRDLMMKGGRSEANNRSYCVTLLTVVNFTSR